MSINAFTHIFKVFMQNAYNMCSGRIVGFKRPVKPIYNDSYMREDFV
jgi:hypothetical protein